MNDIENLSWKMVLPGKADETLFIKKGEYFLIIQIYVDDIIFSAANNVPCQEFSNLLRKEFEVSVVGELNLFTGASDQAMPRCIFINQGNM